MFLRSCLLYVILSFLWVNENPALAQDSAARKKMDSLGINDLQYLRKMSGMVKDMEEQLNITAENMAERVTLVKPAAYDLPDTNISVVKVPYADDLNSALFSYAHTLYNAVHVPALKKLVYKAKQHKINKTAFADSLSMMEAKAVYNTILTGLETGTTMELPYPPSLINAVIDKVKRRINTATALYMAYNFVRQQAKDANGVLLYDVFIAYYQKVTTLSIIPGPAPQASK